MVDSRYSQSSDKKGNGDASFPNVGIWDGLCTLARNVGADSKNQDDDDGMHKRDDDSAPPEILGVSTTSFEKFKQLPCSSSCQCCALDDGILTAHIHVIPELIVVLSIRRQLGQLFGSIACNVENVCLAVLVIAFRYANDGYVVVVEADGWSKELVIHSDDGAGVFPARRQGQVSKDLHLAVHLVLVQSTHQCKLPVDDHGLAEAHLTHQLLLDVVAAF